MVMPDYKFYIQLIFPFPYEVIQYVALQILYIPHQALKQVLKHHAQQGVVAQNLMIYFLN